MKISKKIIIKSQKTVVFLTFFIYNKKQIETKRKKQGGS